MPLAEVKAYLRSPRPEDGSSYREDGQAAAQMANVTVSGKQDGRFLAMTQGASETADEIRRRMPIFTRADVAKAVAEGQHALAGVLQELYDLQRAGGFIYQRAVDEAASMGDHQEARRLAAEILRQQALAARAKEMRDSLVIFRPKGPR